MKKVILHIMVLSLILSAFLSLELPVFALKIGDTLRFEVEDQELIATYDNKAFDYVEPSWGVSGSCPQLRGTANQELFMVFRIDVPSGGYYDITYAGRHHETGQNIQVSLGTSLGLSEDSFSLDTSEDILLGTVDASKFGSHSNRIIKTALTIQQEDRNYLSEGSYYLKLKTLDRGAQSSGGEKRLNCDYIELSKVGEDVLKPLTLTILDPKQEGDVSGAGEYLFGSVVTAQAIPREGYRFLEWTDQYDNPLSKELDYTFTLRENTVLQAVFTANYFRAAEDYVLKEGSKSFYNQVDSSANLGEFSRFEGTEIGDRATYLLNIIEAGEYQLSYRYRQHESTGIVQHYVNQRAIGEEKDHYTAGQANHFAVHNLGVVALEQGFNEITFEMVGKNSTIQGEGKGLYQVNILDFSLTPKEELPEHKQLSRTVKVACVGDSITEGSGSSSESRTYPAQLQQLLGDSYQVENFGVGGCTLLKNGNSPYWQKNKYRASLDFQPDIVIIMLGTNDAKQQNYPQFSEQFVPDFEELIDSYTALTSNPKVYVATSPYAPESNFGISGTLIEEKIVPLQQTIAANKGCELIDIFSDTYGRYSFYHDGIHPNDKGYSLVASSFHKSISKYLPSDVTEESTEESPDFQEVYLPNLDNISGSQGTEIEIPIVVNGIGENIYRSIESVLEIPDGFTVVDVIDKGTLSGGVLRKGVQENGAYRFAYLNYQNDGTLSVTNPSGSETIASLRLRLDRPMAEGSTAILKVVEFTAKESRDGTGNTSPNDYISTTFDVTKAKSKLSISTGVPGEATATAKILYQGDGKDLISTDKTAVSVVFTETPATKAITFDSHVFYHSPQRSSQTNQVIYVGIVDSSTTLAELNDIDNYRITDGPSQPLVFGNTNEDSAIDAQDALNILDSWLRQIPTDTDKKILERNVTSDGRIDTSDALAVVDYFVNGRDFYVTVK